MATVTPVPAEVLNTIDWPPVVLLRTTYILLTAGQMTFRLALSVPVNVTNIRRASSVAPLATVSVWLASDITIAAVPAIAASVSEVIPLLTVSPQVP